MHVGRLIVDNKCNLDGVVALFIGFLFNRAWSPIYSGSDKATWQQHVQFSLHADHRYPANTGHPSLCAVSLSGSAKHTGALFWGRERVYTLSQKQNNLTQTPHPALSLILLTQKIQHCCEPISSTNISFWDAKLCQCGLKMWLRFRHAQGQVVFV